MHTVWVRLNAVVFFGLSALLGFSVLAAISKIGHSNRHVPSEYHRPPFSAAMGVQLLITCRIPYCCNILRAMVMSFHSPIVTEPVPDFHLSHNSTCHLSPPSFLICYRTWNATVSNLLTTTPTHRNPQTETQKAEISEIPWWSRQSSSQLRPSRRPQPCLPLEHQTIIRLCCRIVQNRPEQK